MGGPKAARLKLRVLISELDTPAATPAGNTEVIYLRYLEAKTLAPLLSKIAQNIAGGKDAASSHFEANAASALGATANNAQKDAASTSNNAVIQAEPNTNAIIITAAPTLMQALKAVVNKLDIRPASSIGGGDYCGGGRK